MSNSKLRKSFTPGTTASARSCGDDEERTVVSQVPAHHPHFSPGYKRFRDTKIGVFKLSSLSRKKNEAEKSPAKRDRSREGLSLALLASDPYLNEADDESETVKESSSRKRKLVPAKAGVKKRRTNSDAASFSVKTKLSQFISPSRTLRRRSSVVNPLPYVPAKTSASVISPFISPSAPSSPTPPSSTPPPSCAAPSSGHPPSSAPAPSSAPPPPSAPSSAPLPPTLDITFSGTKRKHFFYRTPDSLQSLFQTSFSDKNPNFESYKAGVLRPDDGEGGGGGGTGGGGREVGGVCSDDAAEARSTLSSSSKKRKRDVDKSIANKTRLGKDRDTPIGRTITERDDDSSDCENAASAKKLKAKARVQQSLEKTLLKKKLDLEVMKRSYKGKGPKTIDSGEDRVSVEPSTSGLGNAVDVHRDDFVSEKIDQILYNVNDTHCPICFSKGILSQLTHCFIDIDDIISVCPQSGCSYPIGLAVTTIKSTVGVDC